MEDKLQDVVAYELERAGLEPQTPLGPLCRYLELLQRWGQRINLTGDPRPVQVARQLLPDTAVLAAALPAEVRSVVDVGSGSGIVGLVLAVLRPALAVQLVEPHGRRCSFLRTAAHQLELNQLTIAEARLEQLELLPRDLAASRATWPPEQWLRRGGGLVRERGLVVAFLTDKPPPCPAGLQLERCVPYALTSGAPRQLALYRRG